MAKNRAEWLKERNKGIGASDAAAILGLSPYMSNQRLWEIKTGRFIPEDIGEKPYVKYGVEAEKHIRALFALENPQYRVGYEEFRIAQNPKHPFICATLDGWRTEQSGRMGVWECKTTEIRKAADWQEWTGRVPENYYIQLLHQLLATGYDFAILTARIIYTDRNGNRKTITQDYRFERSDVLDDLKYLLQKEIEFWECVKADKKPALILPAI